MGFVVVDQVVLFARTLAFPHIPESKIGINIVLRLIHMQVFFITDSVLALALWAGLPLLHCGGWLQPSRSEAIPLAFSITHLSLLSSL